MVVIENAGEQVALLSSVALLLERQGSMSGDELLAVATEVESGGCAGLARGCMGDHAASPGSELLLFDADSNDVIALDVNNDGFVDLVTGDAAGSVSVLLSAGP